MNWRRASLVKTLLFLFALNTISLFLYIFRSHPAPTENHQSLTNTHKSLTENHKPSHLHLPYHGKPWPILPSYLPWSLNPNLSFGSCEAYFGNGFSRRIDLLRSTESLKTPLPSSGWFRCFYSKTLESSICEGGGIRMNPERIRMSIGGESLDSVIGRREEEELPSFEQGSLEILRDGGVDRVSGQKVMDQEFLDQFVPVGNVHIHTMRSLLDSMRVVDYNEFECSQWIEDPTLLVTRFEYANLFHTITDWYNAYVASRVTGLPNRPHLIFVDGHCKASLEETWEALFSTLRYAKHFTGPVCFRHVIFSPLGYETALFKGLTETINCDGAPSHDLWLNPNNQKTARLSEFGEMLRAAFNIRIIKNKEVKPLSSLKVLFVRREDYLAHPRHNGRVESRLSNEQEVFDAMKIWATNHTQCKVNLINGLFAHMNMKEQIRLIQDSSVIIGAHGAGLTHIVSATTDTVVLEIISSQYRRPHFALIAKWRGLEYHAINLAGSHAEPATVISKLSDILGSFGC